MSETAQITRNYSKASIEILQEASTFFDMPYADLAEEFGYTRGAIKGWIDSREIPTVFAVGLALRMRIAKQQRKVVVIGALRSHVTPDVARHILTSLFDEFTFAE